jgi:hypothetical protein
MRHGDTVTFLSLQRRSVGPGWENNATVTAAAIVASILWRMGCPLLSFDVTFCLQF